MNEAQKMAFERALNLLLAVSSHIKYAIECDGEVYGNAKLEAEVPVKGKRGTPGYRRPLKAPYGTHVSYLKPFLVELKAPGNAASVPYGPYAGEVRELRRHVSSYLAARFGKKSCFIAENDATQCMDVMVEKVLPAAQITIFDVLSQGDGTDGEA